MYEEVLKYDSDVAFSFPTRISCSAIRIYNAASATVTAAAIPNLTQPITATINIPASVSS